MVTERWWPRNYEYYENLQIVWFNFFTDMLLFVNIRSTLNIYWFIGIWIHCKWITICSLSTISNIRSGIRWAIMKVMLNYSTLPNKYPQWDCSKKLLKIINCGCKLFQMKHNQDKSVAIFCCQVAAWVPNMFSNFDSVKSHKIANNSATSEAREKICADSNIFKCMFN
jgi:hypothetical protein